MLPPKIKAGDCIGVFSPSSPATFFAKERYERAKRFLKDKGFHIIDGSLTGKSDFYRSDSIRERADELNELIRNPDVKCIMSSIGGLNSNSILPYIDYEQLIKTPKIIIGYSDMTAILFAVYVQTGINTFYGPAMVPSFGELNPFLDLTYEYFREIVIDDLSLPHIFPTPDVWTDEFVPWGREEQEKTGHSNTLITLNTGVAEDGGITFFTFLIKAIRGFYIFGKILYSDIIMKQLTISRLPETIENNNVQEAFEFVRNLDPQMIDVLNWENDFPYRPDVCFRIAYNPYAFYFYVEVKEKYIRAKASQNNGRVWLDSCVEFFLSPEGNKDYYNLELNCIGTKLLGFKRWQEDPIHASDEMLALIHAKSSLGNTPFEEKSGEFSWNMEMVIPFKVYWKHSIRAEKGLSMRANFYKCGDELQEPHFLSWNPIQTPSPSFHQPDYFGEIILE